MTSTTPSTPPETVKDNPTAEDLEDLLLICRYGELEELQQFVDRFGKRPLEKCRDEDGNGVLHMVCGNGHLDLLNYLLPILPSSSSTLQNTSARSTPLHWATINRQLEVIKMVVEVCGVGVLDIQNSKGRSVITEAEMSGWDEGATWMVGVMSVDAKEEEGEESVEEEALGNVEVEIQDSEGRIAKMNLGAGGGSREVREGP